MCQNEKLMNIQNSILHTHHGLNGPPSLLKLFVGQIPRHLSEIHVRPLFDPFGPILEFTILKDKITGIHKGCAFLTYANNEDAINAINAVHEKIVLPGVSIGF